jgi:hypothetical protein
MAGLPFMSLLNETPLVREVTCPNCWHNFPPEGAQWISVHPKLADEPRLPKSAAGGSAQRRFIPERFDVEGRAIDSEGTPCTQLACPRCRLLIPRASLEMPSIVLSILGAPGSGKSVFLTSMIFSLRQQSSRLGLRFHDADLTLNQHLIEDERKMFLDLGAEKFRPINDAIEKTQLDDKRYRASMIDGHWAKFVPPFTFLISPSADHPRFLENNPQLRLLCLYDNAGEHFLPGTDAADKPMARHLAASKGLMYVFDPTKDRRLGRKLGGTSTAGRGSERQDVVLVEAANRIREHAGLAQSARLPQPLIIVLTKFDVWKSLLPDFNPANPLVPCPGATISSLQMDEVESTSSLCRDLLDEYCPEIVTAAESVSDNVLFVPVAAVGWDVRTDKESGVPIFQAADCEPFGVLVPLLTLLTKTIPKIVTPLRRRSNRP